MPTNVAQFESLFREKARDLPARKVRDLQKKIALDIIRKVTAMTPVDTGRARSGWDLTIATLASAETRHADPVSAAEEALKGLPKFAIVYVQNLVPYIGYLENGWSKQAPEGMLGVTLAEVSSTL